MTAAHDGLAEFLATAERDGFDVAHNWQDGKGWVFFNPATADIWKYWQASRAALGAGPVARTPLSDAQIDALWGGGDAISVPQRINRRAIARSIERAHGIGGCTT